LVFRPLLQCIITYLALPFRELSADQILALVTVANEGKVTHARLKSMTTAHLRDLSQVLSSLVRDGFLESDGATRGTFYFFPGEPPCLEDNPIELSYGLGMDILGKDLPASSDHLPASSDHWSSLITLATPVRAKGKVSKELMRKVILNLCREQFLTQKELAKLLERSPNTLRTSYLNQMVSDDQLELKYPDKRTHPYQAYHNRRP
jgi:ATP-dependent DNA helicase RecG